MSFDCRRVLREVLGASALDSQAPDVRDHLAGCRFCAARVAVRDALVPALKERPMPAEGARVLLDDVRARIVEQAEDSRLGRLLGEAMPVAPLPATDRDGLAHGWPVSLLESDLARINGAPVRGASDIEWARVRGAILAEVSNRGAPVRRWLTVGVASAALVAVALLLVARGEPEAPRIVFRDLDAADVAAIPAFDFAVDASGAGR